MRCRVAGVEDLRRDLDGSHSGPAPRSELNLLREGFWAPYLVWSASVSTRLVLFRFPVTCASIRLPAGCDAAMLLLPVLDDRRLPLLTLKGKVFGPSADRCCCTWASHATQDRDGEASRLSSQLGARLPTPQCWTVRRCMPPLSC